MKLFDPNLLNLFPYHREKEKRTQVLTLDELIDDYRRAYTLTGAEFDFLMMSYRYEHPFQKFLATFARGKLKPPALIDLLRLAFAALLTRDSENEAQLTHALVEQSKQIFGPHTATLANAFCRQVLRDKNRILGELEKDPALVLGPHLTARWKAHPELISRFAKQIASRPHAGVTALTKDGSFATIPQKEFVAGKHLAMSEGSYAFVRWMTDEISRAKLPHEISLLDMCAAPGGKLIALVNALAPTAHKLGRTDAVDSKFKRLERLKENLKLWRLDDSTTVTLHDWTEPDTRADKYNVVLADLPCTGLGTLATRPDILLEDWSESDAELFRLQSVIVEAAKRRADRPGLVFVSICSGDPSEIEHLSAQLLAPPGFRAQLGDKNNEEITAWAIRAT